MALEVQVVLDAGSPRALGDFWKIALGYVEEPPPAGFATWDEALDAWGLPPDDRDVAYAIIDPDGAGPRVFFQRVPEGKTAKNRVHLDVRYSAAQGVDREDRAAKLAAAREHVAVLVAAGGSVLTEVDDPREGAWVVMADPEGNEFCVT
ncbi:VOC family protein [Cellulomonas triticagri]|uniref:VOC family protein n=1 Tax=Cellulomonas triticagri TaxID=2483352 RepID=A0A3M2JBC2_9CELL|nr:VOC family protein [Cellulomonas triticagri]RMI08813.1 VOC family protein [Cellulomonas triticagri]